MASYNDSLTWCGEQSVSGLNVTANINLGYKNLSRSGNTVSFYYDIYIRCTGSMSNNRFACKTFGDGGTVRTIKPTGGSGGSWSWFPAGYYSVSKNSSTGSVSSSSAASSRCNTYGDPIYYETTVGSSATSLSLSVPVADTGWNTGWTNFHSGSPTTKTFTISIPIVRHTVSYNANGGTSTPSSQTVNAGTAINLASAISKNNTESSGTITVSYDANGGSGAPGNSTGTYVNTTPYTFNKWAAGSTSGTQYSAGASYTVNSDVTMYATWNTGTTTRKSNPSITLSSTRPTRTYYTFSHWYNGNNTYNPGTAYTFSSNTTLYASWTPNAPTNLTISRTGSTTNSISVSVGATGLTMTNYTLYYRAGTSGNYTAKSLGTATTGTITGLSTDTNYQIYFTATNAGGTSTSSTVTYSTTLGNPTITSPTKRNLFPYMCDISATGSITPSRTLTYAFTKDGGTNWTSYQSSNTYHWADLIPETSYNMGVKVKATHVGTNASDTTATSYLTITTPTDQARTRVKVNGQWKKGRTFIKHENKWKKAKAVYIKVDGHWVENKNFYDGEPSIWD